MEAYEASLDKITSKLSESQKEVFSECLGVIALQTMDIGSLFSEALSNAGNEKEMGKDAINGAIAELDGLTYSDIIAKGKPLLIEQYTEQLEEVAKEIVSGDSIVQKIKADTEKLKSFEVSNPRIYYGSYSWAGTTLVFTIKNNSTDIISKMAWKGVVREEGREVSYCDDTFRYSIPGGLEPGEDKRLRLEPNMSSSLYLCDLPKSKIFEVTTIGVWDKNDVLLYDASEISDDAFDLLESFKKEKADAESKLKTLEEF